MEEDEEDEDEEDEDEDEEDVESSFDDSTRSPLGHKLKKTSFHHPEPVIGLRDEDMTIDQVDADETMTIGSSDEQSEEDEEEDEDEEGTNNADDATSEGTNDEEEWTPPPKQPKSKSTDEPPQPLQKQTSNVKAKSKTSIDVGSLQRKMDVLSLFADEEDKENISGQIPKSKSKKAVHQDDISISEDPVVDEPLAKSKTKYVMSTPFHIDH